MPTTTNVKAVLDAARKPSRKADADEGGAELELETNDMVGTGGRAVLSHRPRLSAIFNHSSLCTRFARHTFTSGRTRSISNFSRMRPSAWITFDAAAVGRTGFDAERATPAYDTFQP